MSGPFYYESSDADQKVEEEGKGKHRLTIERMVKLGRVSRSGFYRFQTASQSAGTPEPDLETGSEFLASFLI